tara:strand:+ start:1285 stop:1518 length:234 start_codon:yes stop_codon:yes gene_type:complete
MSENVIPTITIDGVEYEIDQLSEEHKNVINHMQVADQEIQRLNTMIAILSTGRQAYINQLGEELNKKEPEFTPEVVK